MSNLPSSSASCSFIAAVTSFSSCICKRFDNIAIFPERASTSFVRDASKAAIFATISAEEGSAAKAEPGAEAESGAGEAGAGAEESGADGASSGEEPSAAGKASGSTDGESGTGVIFGEGAAAAAASGPAEDEDPQGPWGWGRLGCGWTTPSA